MVRSKSTPIEPMRDRCRLCHDKGFSVIELLIVISVIGILTAISIPNILAQLPKYRLNGAARQVMGELMAARMKAVSQNRKVRVFFSSDIQQYRICDDANNDGTVDNCEGNARIKNIQADYYDVRFTATSPQNTTFSPRGTASVPSLTVTLSSSNCSSCASKKVKVHTTGRVKIE